MTSDKTPAPITATPPMPSEQPPEPSPVPEGPKACNWCGKPNEGQRMVFPPPDRVWLALCEICVMAAMNAVMDVYRQQVQELGQQVRDLEDQFKDAYDIITEVV